MNTLRKLPGFTLFEIMIVIAIIGILLTVVISGINQTKARSNDEAIAADLEQVALALESFQKVCKTYPKTLLATDASSPYGPSSSCSKQLSHFIPAQLPKIKFPWTDQNSKIDYIATTEPINPAVGAPIGSGVVCTGYRLGYQMSSQKSQVIARSKNSGIIQSSVRYQCLSRSTTIPAKAPQDVNDDYYYLYSR